MSKQRSGLRVSALLKARKVMKKNSFIIRNGLIVNGKNEKPREGSVVVKDGIISEVIYGTGGLSGHGNGRLRQYPDQPETGTKAGPPDMSVIDAEGAYITPGFIDIHRHGDWRAFPGKEGTDDELLNRQGITTVVNGNCGLSVMPARGQHADEIRHFLEPVTGTKPDAPWLSDADADLASYFKALSNVRRTVNTGMLAGNGTIRACAAGYHPGKLTAEELKGVQRDIEKSLSDGALGISLGLGYAPEFEYDVDGLALALAPLKGTDVPITTHIRGEGDGSYESILEVTEVAEKLGIPLHISHMKCIGKRNWHTGPEKTLAFLHRKNREGCRIDYDLYPYRTGSTQLFHVIPPAFQAGGTDRFIEGLKDKRFRDDLTKALKTPSHEFENIVELVGFDNIYAETMHSDEFARFSGSSISSIAAELQRDPYETLYDLLTAEHCEVTMLDTIACEEDVRTFYRDPLSSVISDAIYPDGGRLHPRVYAAFPEFLIRYCRDSGLLPIEEAIWKMTKKPADVLGIKRGVIEEGMPADLCIFKLEELCANATFEDPEQFCTGFRYVINNGAVVVENDVWKSENEGSGMIVRRGF